MMYKNIRQFLDILKSCYPQGGTKESTFKFTIVLPNQDRWQPWCYLPNKNASLIYGIKLIYQLIKTDCSIMQFY